jgi:hypothetical protein
VRADTHRAVVGTAHAELSYYNCSSLCNIGFPMTFPFLMTTGVKHCEPPKDTKEVTSGKMEEFSSGAMDAATYHKDCASLRYEMTVSSRRIVHDGVIMFKCKVQRQSIIIC